MTTYFEARWPRQGRAIGVRRVAVALMVLAPRLAAAQFDPAPDLDTAASTTRRLRAVVDGLCLPPTVTRALARKVDTVTRALDVGDGERAAQRLGVLFRAAAVQGRGAAQVSILASLAAGQMSTGTAPDVPAVDDPAAALDVFADKVSASLAPSVARRFASSIAKARAGFVAGSRDDALRWLGKLAQQATGLVQPTSSPTDRTTAVALIGDVVGIMTHFDPVPLVRRFRDALRAGDFEGALSEVVRSRRDAHRARLVARLDANARARIYELFTTDLELQFARATLREYAMTRNEAVGRVSYVLTFGPDCDGQWRLRNF